MKKIAFIIQVAMLGFLSSCDFHDPHPGNEVPCVSSDDRGLVFDLKLGHPKYIWQLRSTFEFDSLLSDSRCPINAICVWEGEVEIKLLIDPGRQPQFPLVLKNTDSGKVVSIRGKRYLIKLVDVHPYPGVDSVDVIPFATIEVRRVCKNDPDPCRLEPDPGPCDGSFVRYYYDSIAGECKEFIYGGCGGVVPFETLEKCKSCPCSSVDEEND